MSVSEKPTTRPIPSKVKAVLALIVLLMLMVPWAMDFRRADRNNDGALDINEARLRPEVYKKFELMDRNDDGLVHQAEIFVHKMLDSQDVNRDMKLSQAEVKNRRLSKRFSEYDIDGDGFLDEGELALASDH